MNLNLNRPLCFFDLETTGIDIANDRIRVAILKLMPDRKNEKKYGWSTPVSDPKPLLMLRNNGR